MDDEYFTIEEASEESNIPSFILTQMIADGQLETREIGFETMISASSLARAGGEFQAPSLAHIDRQMSMLSVA